jgi:hypothetical protein
MSQVQAQTYFFLQIDKIKIFSFIQSCNDYSVVKLYFRVFYLKWIKIMFINNLFMDGQMKISDFRQSEVVSVLFIC